jgi:hypothetical protein
MGRLFFNYHKQIIALSVLLLRRESWDTYHFTKGKKMIKLKKKHIDSYTSKIKTGSMIYAYESANQDATRTHQPSPEQIQRLREEEQRRQELAALHTEPTRQVLIAAAAGAIGGAAGGPKGFLTGSVVGAIAGATAQCQSCHK